MPAPGGGVSEELDAAGGGRLPASRDDNPQLACISYIWCACPNGYTQKNSNASNVGQIILFFCEHHNFEYIYKARPVTITVSRKKVMQKTTNLTTLV